MHYIKNRVNLIYLFLDQSLSSESLGRWLLIEKPIQYHPINYFWSITQLGTNSNYLAHGKICLNHTDCKKPNHMLSGEPMLTNTDEQISRDRRLNQVISLSYSYSYLIPSSKRQNCCQKLCLKGECDNEANPAVKDFNRSKKKKIKKFLTQKHWRCANASCWFKCVQRCFGFVFCFGFGWQVSFTLASLRSALILSVHLQPV